MDRRKLSHLIHVLTSFMMTLIISRLAGILLGGVLGGVWLSLVMFLISSLVGVVIYYVMPDDFIEGGGDEFETPPICTRGLGDVIPHFFICLTALTAFMYCVTLFLDGNNFSAYIRSEPVEFSLVYFLSLCVIHPAVEEFIFRYLYYCELRYLSPVFGLLCQSVIFALTHDTVDGMIYALGAGVILALLLENTGRLLPCLLAHALTNFRSLLYLPVFEGMPTVRGGIDAVIIALGIISSLYILLRRGQAIRRVSGASSGEDGAESGEKAGGSSDSSGEDDDNGR